VLLPFTVALRPGRPLHDQVVFAVTKAIVTGQLRAGDRFPSVRTLSQELEINPNTAQKVVATTNRPSVWSSTRSGSASIWRTSSIC
jgi:GntR family transcriptional regulator